MIAGFVGRCVVRLQSVSKAYGAAGRETKALRAVSLEAHRGELLLLMGPSGSGKTTLLTIVAGLQRPTAGSVELFGRGVSDYSPRDLQWLRAGRIGFVFQTFHLIDSLTVLENVALVMRFARVGGRGARRRARRLLGTLGIGHLEGARPPTLSQGERQRVAIARALANGAELILADEPTASLSSAQGLEVVRLLHEQAKTSGRCVIVVSHDERITRYADRVLHLEDGRLTAPNRAGLSADRSGAGQAVLAQEELGNDDRAYGVPPRGPGWMPEPRREAHDSTWPAGNRRQNQDSVTDAPTPCREIR
jgi:ABC-type lipoprotein export system ATPase subunit